MENYDFENSTSLIVERLTWPEACSLIEQLRGVGIYANFDVGCVRAYPIGQANIETVKEYAEKLNANVFEDAVRSTLAQSQM